MRQPVLFVSHGAPSLLVEREAPARAFLAGLGAALPRPRPRAIVAVSAHWEADRALVGRETRPETIHDFSGFGPELEAWRYPCPGDPALAEAVAERLRAAGIASATVERGLDHGAWAPLALIHPAADLPVVPVALPPGGEAEVLALGRALAPLRDEGVLILGSGAVTHPLRDVLPGVDTPPAWIRPFEAWLSGAVAAGDLAALAAWRQAPQARRVHPTPEHLLPLFACLGAAGAEPAQELHRSWTWGVLAMTCWRWG